MKKVVFYGTTINQRELEVIERIWVERDTKKKAELILSLSNLGLDYAIYSFGKKNSLFNYTGEYNYIESFNLYALPLLFLISYRRKLGLTDAVFSDYHLSPEQWIACNQLYLEFWDNPKIHYTPTLLKITDKNGVLDSNFVNVLCEVVTDCSQPRAFTNNQKVSLRMHLPEDNLKRFCWNKVEIELSTLVSETLHVLNWIAMLLEKQAVA